MKILALSVVFLCGPVFAALADLPIPADSVQPWDFRNKPRKLPIEAYAPFYECGTYEELRESVLKVSATLAPSQAADCRLILIRTYYILGDIKSADTLLAKLAKPRQQVKRIPDGKLALAKAEGARGAPKLLEMARALDAKKDRKCLKIYAGLLSADNFAIRWMSLDRLRQLTDQDFE